MKGISARHRPHATKLSALSRCHRPSVPIPKEGLGLRSLRFLARSPRQKTDVSRERRDRPAPRGTRPFVLWLHPSHRRLRTITYPILIVTVTEIMSAYSDRRWGCQPGVRWGIRTGYRIKRHPQTSPKPQDNRSAGGSAGIPDSLGHKRVDTSGPASRPASVPLWGGHAPFCSHLRRNSSSPFGLFNFLSSISLLPCVWHFHSSRPRLPPGFTGFADLRKPATAPVNCHRTGPGSPCSTNIMAGNGGDSKESWKLSVFPIAGGARQSHN